RLHTRGRYERRQITWAGRVRDPDVERTARLVAEHDDEVARKLVDRRRDVGAAAVERVRKTRRGARDRSGHDAAAPGVPAVGRLRDERGVVLRALLVRPIDVGDVDGAVGPHPRRRILVELVAGVADPDRARPAGAVVVGVGEVDRRLAGAAELRPGDVEPAEVVTGAGSGVDRSGLVIGELPVRPLLAAVRDAGDDRHSR